MRSQRVPPRPLPARTVYFVHAGGAAFAFTVMATLASIYRIEVVGLAPLELILVGTVLEATVLLAELPTGVVADTISRRWSLIVGTVLIGAGFALEGLVPTIASVMVAQMIWGLGAAFESGAVEAWLADEIGAAHAEAAFLRAAQIQNLAVVLAIPAAALLGGVYLGYPILAGGIGFLVLAGFLFVSMEESAFDGGSAPGLHPLRGIAATLRRGVELGVRRPLVWTILAVAVFAGASTEVFDRLWEARMLAGPGLPEGIGAATWFAALAMASAVLGIAAAEIARRALARDAGPDRARRPLVALLFGVTLLQAGAVAVFGLAGRIDLAVATYLLARVGRIVQAPLYRAWLNRELEPATRATAFSAAGVADALGQVAGGPLLGVIAMAAGMPAAFVVAATLLGPAAWLVGRTWSREPR